MSGANSSKPKGAIRIFAAHSAQNPPPVHAGAGRLGRQSEERLRIRQEIEKPVLESLTAIVKERILAGGLLPKSKFSQALNYYLDLAPHFANYLNHPDARLDNNVAERAVRPLTIGRKNWMFVGSENGGQASATILSLVQTCRNLGINPQEYLEDVLRRIMGHPARRIEELLPDLWLAATTEECRIADGPARWRQLTVTHEQASERPHSRHPYGRHPADHCLDSGHDRNARQLTPSILAAYPLFHLKNQPVPFSLQNGLVERSDIFA